MSPAARLPFSGTPFLVHLERGKEVWAGFAGRAAQSEEPLSLGTHRFLASHSSSEVRRSWSERSDLPGEVVAERVGVETDPVVLRFLHVLNPEGGDSVDAEEVFLKEGRLALLGRAMNPYASEADAAAYLGKALSGVTSVRGQRALEIAVRHAGSWKERPLALKVLVQSAGEIYHLAELADACGAELELVEALIVRAKEVAESEYEALFTCLGVTFSPEVIDLFARSFSGSADEEVGKVLEAVLDLGKGGLGMVLEVPDTLATSRTLLIASRLAERYFEMAKLGEFLEGLDRERRNVALHVPAAVGRSALGNPRIDLETARKAVDLLSDSTIQYALLHLEGLSPAAREALWERQVIRRFEVKVQRGNSMQRPRPEKEDVLAGALGMKAERGLISAPSGMLLGIMSPWLGTSAEETFAGLLSGWEGTLFELFEAVLAVESSAPELALPEPLEWVEEEFDEAPF